MESESKNIWIKFLTPFADKLVQELSIFEYVKGRKKKSKRNL